MANLRVATWNVYWGSVTRAGKTTTPAQRLVAFTTFCGANGVHIVAFQEVPQALINKGALNKLVAGTPFGYLFMAREYAPGGSVSSSNSSSTGYVILYAKALLTPKAPPDFMNPKAFMAGASMGRPPLYTELTPNKAHGGTIRFITWHNEAGALADTPVGTLSGGVKSLSRVVIAGDLNVKKSSIASPRFPGWWSINQELDHVIASAKVAEVTYSGSFESDAHHALIVDVAITV